MRYAFVVTYGRSGSTLVQGLLNELPNTLIRGENNFFVLPLFRAVASVRSFKRLHGKAAASKGVRSAFYGLDEVQVSDIITDTRALVTRQLLGSVDPGTVDVLGFKEVLWHQIRPRETAAFFGFLDSTFPDARYVLHRRDHDQVVGSGFWRKQDSSDVTKLLQRVEEVQDFLRETRPDRVHSTRYDLFTHDDPAVVTAELADLARFVSGTSSDNVVQAMRATLDVGHGPHPFETDRGGDET